jgi:3-isopropylmalate/(R)-2-methylmalate dehydratase small subunit
VDLARGTIKDLANGNELSFSPLPQVMITILNDGGLAAHIQKHGDFKLE